ncbi:MAG: carboxypeptidase-like regulatory domain-containing protein [bacterium]
MGERVVNADNGQPLVLVQVYLCGLQRGDVTDDDGHFRIARLKAGTYSVTFQLQGFRRLLKKEVVLRANETVELNVAMQEEAIEFDGLLVTANCSHR